VGSQLSEVPRLIVLQNLKSARACYSLYRLHGDSGFGSRNLRLAVEDVRTACQKLQPECKEDGSASALRAWQVLAELKDLEQQLSELQLPVAGEGPMQQQVSADAAADTDLQHDQEPVCDAAAPAGTPCVAVAHIQPQGQPAAPVIQQQQLLQLQMQQEQKRLQLQQLMQQQQQTPVPAAMFAQAGLRGNQLVSLAAAGPAWPSTAGAVFGGINYGMVQQLLLQQQQQQALAQTLRQFGSSAVGQSYGETMPQGAGVHMAQNQLAPPLLPAAEQLGCLVGSSSTQLAATPQVLLPNQSLQLYATRSPEDAVFSGQAHAAGQALADGSVLHSVRGTQALAGLCSNAAMALPGLAYTAPLLAAGPAAAAMRGEVPLPSL